MREKSGVEETHTFIESYVSRETYFIGMTNIRIFSFFMGFYRYFCIAIE